VINIFRSFWHDSGTFFGQIIFKGNEAMSEIGKCKNVLKVFAQFWLAAHRSIGLASSINETILCTAADLCWKPKWFHNLRELQPLRPNVYLIAIFFHAQRGDSSVCRNRVITRSSENHEQKWIREKYSIVYLHALICISPIVKYVFLVPEAIHYKISSESTVFPVYILYKHTQLFTNSLVEAAVTLTTTFAQKKNTDKDDYVTEWLQLNKLTNL